MMALIAHGCNYPLVHGIDTNLGAKSYLHRICKLLDSRKHSSSTIDAELDFLGEMAELNLLKSLQAPNRW